MIWIAAALVWAVAEASFFFVVPDVLLTALVLRARHREALIVAVLAAVAAGLTGVAMATWGMSDPAGALAAMLRVPAVGPDLVARVSREMAGSWWGLAMIGGAVSGVPYKLYAVEAGARHFALLPFFLMSVAARLARFALSIGIVGCAGAGLDRIGRSSWKAPLLALGWLAIYAVYFSLRAAV